MFPNPALESEAEDGHVLEAGGMTCEKATGPAHKKTLHNAVKGTVHEETSGVFLQSCISSTPVLKLLFTYNVH